MKKLTACLAALILVAGCMVSSAAAIYMDVPAEDVLAPEVEKATQYGLMNGYGNGLFGFRDSMTRAQFATVLGRMLGWFEEETAFTGHVTKEMQVDPVSSGVYWHAIEAAAAKDVVNRNQPFRPNDAITRGEMAEMLVRALGLKSAAERLEKGSLPFVDVASRKGYIAVAYDIGMTKGTSAVTFSPEATATRAQAAAMLLRIYEKLNGREETWLHAYYAISSYSQLNLAEKADAVTLGWSRMTWDDASAHLLTTSKSGNEYYNSNDLYWLSRIIEAEASGESQAGKIAVGNCVINRVNSKEFPNTIYGVIFDTKYGVQYQPTANGAIYNNPSDASVQAAKDALSGHSVVGNALYFCSVKVAPYSWASKNRPYLTTIGNHVFYL